MDLNKTTSYVLKILSFMAISNETKYSLEYLFDHLKIPYKYLPWIHIEHSKLGFINISRKTSEKFVFVKNTNEITLYDIIDKIEGNENMNPCLLCMSGYVINHNSCILHHRWCYTRDKISEIFKQTSLNNLKVSQTKKSNSNN